MEVAPHRLGSDLDQLDDIDAYNFDHDDATLDPKFPTHSTSPYNLTLQARGKL